MKAPIKNPGDERGGNQRRMVVKRTKRELAALSRRFDADALLDALAGFMPPAVKP